MNRPCEDGQSVPRKSLPRSGLALGLTDVFRSLQEDHSVGKIAQDFGLTREQLKAVLQSAALGVGRLLD